MCSIEEVLRRIARGGAGLGVPVIVSIESMEQLLPWERATVSYTGESAKAAERAGVTAKTAGSGDVAKARR